MPAYYYLVASLPMLRFEDTLPFSTGEFIGRCRQFLNRRDLALVEAVAKTGSGTVTGENSFARQWNDFALQVRAEMNEQRAAKLSFPPDRYRNRTEKDIHIVETVRAALASDSPLEGELALMRLHWKKAEELSSRHVFDVEALLAYTIHLGILERKSLFTPMEGNAEFKRLFSNLQSIIKSI